MKDLPKNWSLLEQYDDSYIFENSDKSFCVNVDCTPRCDYPFTIGFIQQKGEFTIIGFENGSYCTHSKEISTALDKAVDMMIFIDNAVAGSSFINR